MDLVLLEGTYMEEELKNKIIELVQKIDDIWILNQILKFIKNITK